MSHCPHCGASLTPRQQPLTKRQAEVLAWLRVFITDQGYAPSLEEIAHQFVYSSLATVHDHLKTLERKGYITREYNEARGILLVEPGDVDAIRRAGETEVRHG